MQENKIITVWERYNQKLDKWEHNHISDGFSESEEDPVPNSKLQKRSWPGGIWRKFKAHLEENSVVIDT